MISGLPAPTEGYSALARPSGDGLAEEVRGATPAEVGKRFEGLFASLLLSEMKKTLPSGSFFGGGAGSDVYDGMLERTLGERLAEGGGLGVAAFIERTMTEANAAVSAEKLS
jgi:Rod binding domain-containing protein